MALYDLAGQERERRRQNRFKYLQLAAQSAIAFKKLEEQKKLREAQEKWYSGGMGSMTIDPFTGKIISTPGGTPGGTTLTPQGQITSFPQAPIQQSPSQVDMLGSLGLSYVPQYSPLEGTLAKKYIGETSRSKAMGEASKQALAQETKETAKKQRGFRRVEAKLKQSTEILKNVYTTSMDFARAHSIPLKPGIGLGGRAFGVFQQGLGKLGYNPWVKTYKGHLNEVAIALMRQLMPGRSERLVNLLKQTLPDLSGNPQEDLTQIAESLTTSFADAVATARNNKGEFVVPRNEMVKTIESFKKEAYDYFNKAYIGAGLLKSPIRPSAERKRTFNDKNVFEGL